MKYSNDAFIRHSYRNMLIESWLLLQTTTEEFLEEMKEEMKLD